MAGRTQGHGHLIRDITFRLLKGGQRPRKHTLGQSIQAWAAGSVRILIPGLRDHVNWGVVLPAPGCGPNPEQPGPSSRSHSATATPCGRAAQWQRFLPSPVCGRRAAAPDGSLTRTDPEDLRRGGSQSARAVILLVELAFLEQFTRWW